jgi:hypothetical protein
MNTDVLVKLDGFGLWAHSVVDAAVLVTVDMYYSEQLEGIDLDFEPEEDFDPQLISALSGKIESIKHRMLKSIDAGRLETEHTQRDIDDNIVETDTYIAHDTLVEWLGNHGVSCGEIMQEWEKYEMETTRYIIDEVVKCRIAQSEGYHTLSDIVFADRRGKTVSDEEAEENVKRFDAARADGVDFRVVLAEIDNERMEKEIDTNTSLYLSWKNKVDTIDRLTKMLREASAKGKEHTGPALTARNRKTFLTIIAALCGKAGLQLGGRGAAQRIKEATEEIGAPVSDDTIHSILKEIPDAIEDRMK